MVKIAIAGGSGNVAQEIIDGLVATKKHEILLFTRKDPPPSDPSSAVTWAKTDYLDVKQLTSLLAGTHTVFSFVAPYLDQEEAFNAQKNLIDASIQAGVKRFAPSEWASANFAHLSWYTYKAKTREYLSAINKDAKVLEFCVCSVVCCHLTGRGGRNPRPTRSYGPQSRITSCHTSHQPHTHVYKTQHPDHIHSSLARDAYKMQQHNTTTTYLIPLPHPASTHPAYNLVSPAPASHQL